MTDHASTPPPRIDDELLSAYLDDEVTPAERAAVEVAIETDPAALAMLDGLRSAQAKLREPSISAAPPPDAFIAAALAEISSMSVAEPSVTSISAARSWRQRLADPRLLGAAAAVFALLLAVPLLVLDRPASDDDLATASAEAFNNDAGDSLADEAPLAPSRSIAGDSAGGAVGGAGSSAAYLGDFAGEDDLGQFLSSVVRPQPNGSSFTSNSDSPAAGAAESDDDGAAPAEPSRDAADSPEPSPPPSSDELARCEPPVAPNDSTLVFSSNLTYDGQAAVVFVFQQGDDYAATVISFDNCAVITTLTFT